MRWSRPAHSLRSRTQEEAARIDGAVNKAPDNIKIALGSGAKVTVTHRN
jgi:hypothetical protein